MPSLGIRDESFIDWNKINHQKFIDEPELELTKFHIFTMSPIMKFSLDQIFDPILKKQIKESDK